VARRSVWSDPKVVELAQGFLPAADEVGRLQRGQDAECLLFQKIAEQGHYAGRTQPTNTRQGIYAAAPSGVLLGSINTRDAAAVARMLAQALERWEDLAPEERRMTADARAPVKRLEDRYPEDGLVLRIFARDLGRERAAERADWRSRAWNQDYAWFRKEEARAFLPLEPERGSERDLPPLLADRIVRLQLLDDVRGQTRALPPEAVERARITAKVVGREDDLVKLELEGEARLSWQGRWPVDGWNDRDEPAPQSRGFEGKLLGRATYDLAAERFTAFELVATGTRWGGTQYNGRADDLEPAPIGFALVLAGRSPAERVAPAQLWSYGWN
jgi:hypothetical protein